MRRLDCASRSINKYSGRDSRWPGFTVLLQQKESLCGQPAPRCGWGLLSEIGGIRSHSSDEWRQTGGTVWYCTLCNHGKLRMLQISSLLSRRIEKDPSAWAPGRLGAGAPGLLGFQPSRVSLSGSGEVAPTTICISAQRQSDANVTSSKSNT